MGCFVCSTQVVTGDAAAVVAARKPRRLLVVADPFFEKNGVARSLCQGAEASEFFFGVQPDPSVTLAAEGTRLVQEFQPDTIVALCGGSAMDCAKAMKYFSGSQAALIAIPTTSGSGSEVTDFAIVTPDGVKPPLVDEALRPQMAVLDEKLVAQLPKSLAADGGFDALTHALEAYTATGRSGFTDCLAREAFQRVFSLLPRSVAGTLSARLPVHEAATMAGMAFTQAGLGLCHALAHALGGCFHLPHGRLNAILLPAVMEVNAPVCADRYAQLAQSIGLEARAEAAGARNLRFALVRLRRSLNLPATLAEAGISPSEVQHQTEALVAAALADPCCQTNPAPVTREMTLQVLQQVTGHGR